MKISKKKTLKVAILEISKECHYRCDESWLIKLMQLHTITYNHIQLHTISNISHGVMLVGHSGSGKSSVRNVSTSAMEFCDVVMVLKQNNTIFILKILLINSNFMASYGILDLTTLERTDDVFTAEIYI